MKIEEIYRMWDIDNTIDITDMSNQSANIPKLHNKYFRIYMEEGMKLRTMKASYKQFTKLKTEYYRGELDDSELKENGWEPQRLKILKQEVHSYVDADQEVIDMSLRMGVQEEKVSYLEAIIKMINNRGFQIKSIIDWAKFKSGEM